MQRTARLLSVVAATLLSGGCRMGMHGPQHRPAHRSDGAQPHVVRSAAAPELTLSLDFAPLVAGQVATLGVRVTEGAARTPLGGATVTVRVRPIDGEADRSHLAHAADSTVSLLAGEVVGEVGTYRASHTFRTPGLHEVTVTLHQGKAGESSPFVMTTLEDVRESEPRTPQRVTVLAVLGGLAMAAGMLLRFAF